MCVFLCASVFKQIPVSMVAMGIGMVTGFLHSNLVWLSRHSRILHNSIRVIYAAMFYYVIRCSMHLYIFLHSALYHHSTFSSDCVSPHIVDIWY